MAQRKPEEKTTLDQVLKLIDRLPSEQWHKLLQDLKLEELRREIQVGIDSANRGELIPAEQVFAELKQRITDRKKDNNK